MTAQVRAEIAGKLVEDYGLTLAEVARQVGISTSGVSKLFSRSMSTYSITSLTDHPFFSAAIPGG